MPRPTIPTPKIIADPIYGIFDIRPVLPMVETEEFQALGDKRQLGMSYLTFPSATHSRKAHSLGSYHATRELADRWRKLRLITEREGDALAGFALYHDIGHPAFSHVTEDLCRKDNSGLSLDVIRTLRDPIERCGIDYRLLEKIASGKNPLALAVKDRNLGIEKLDYLERDGMTTLLSRPMGIEYLRQHIYFIDGKLAIDEKAVDSAIEVQNFYAKMYKNVYLRKASVIAQRMLQKMVYRLIVRGEISRDDLPRLTDSELIGMISVSQDEIAKALYGFLKRREFFREAVVLRHRDFVHVGRAPDKATRTFGLSDKEMRKLAGSPALQSKNQESLGRLEREIGNAVGLEEEDILAVPVFAPSRFKPQDILVYSEKRIFVSLRSRYPAHFESMEEIGMAYAAFRICSIEKNRKLLSSPRAARKILQCISDFSRQASL
ncbi:HD domain-containing protein [Candidatus Parcubacteria bacterium]|nr:MAG: HD domain-containing protein [Candidatus Parcubacteria bacterium]